MKTSTVLGVPLIPIALTLATACLGGPDDTVLDITFDPCVTLVLVPGAGTTAAERASIVDAIAMWNRVLPTELTLDDVAGAAQLPIVFEDAPSAIFGFYQDKRGSMIINREITDGHERAVVIAHELGHALGLLHVPKDQTSVMNTPNLTLEPQPFDAASLIALWGECPAGPQRAVAPAAVTP